MSESWIRSDKEGKHIGGLQEWSVERDPLQRVTCIRNTSSKVKWGKKSGACYHLSILSWEARTVILYTNHTKLYPSTLFELEDGHELRHQCALFISQKTWSRSVTCIVEQTEAMLGSLVFNSCCHCWKSTVFGTYSEDIWNHSIWLLLEYICITL